MVDKIRVGIVGATVTPGGSGWGANAHIPALAALPDYELKAVCTTREETAQASKQAFGADLAFTNIDEMVGHPEIDLVVVVVRVPGHRELVLKALRAGKDVFCEWPLGVNLAEAKEMASLADRKGVKTLVGLQARSDPALMYAKQLIDSGTIGQVIAANMTTSIGAQVVRGTGRIWQGVRSNGGNTLTIAGGHAIDALCYLLGEFAEVSARAVTQIKEWTHEESGEPFRVDSPDTISIVGQLVDGCELSAQIVAVPSNPSGFELEIFGREGAITIKSRATPNHGPSSVFLGKGREPLAEQTVPDEFKIAPASTPPGQPRNVAHAYARYAGRGVTSGGSVPDFNAAVKRHELIDAIERSSLEGRAVKMPT